MELIVLAGTHLAGRGTPVELELLGRGDSASGQAARGVATASPWRFDADLIDFEVAAQVAPAMRYADAQQLLAACEPHPLKLFFRLETSLGRWS